MGHAVLAVGLGALLVACGGAPEAADASPTDDASSDVDVDVGPTDAAADGDASYETTFPVPLSEGHLWLNGKTDGLDWGDVTAGAGHAFGTVVSGGPPYDDSTAALIGPWGSEQMACATVFTSKQSSSIFEEVELRLRTTITAHSITGYEFNFRATSDGSQYAQIVRWNGPLDSFDYVSSATGPGLHDGDKVCATAVGSTLTASINDNQVVQGTDATFTGGSPGIGFYMQGGTMAELGDYGFTTFYAGAM